MSDTLVSLGSEVTWFATSSDRPAGEAQVVEAHPRRRAGGELATQYLTLSDPGARPVLGSRPTWLWGFEHGLNDAGVAVGNEKIWTTEDPHRAPDALIGMDLVRLAVERAADADEAVTLIGELLERHGQGGSAEPGGGAPYWSSFLVADEARAWVIETSGSAWVAEAMEGSGAISNGISLSTGWTRSSPDVAEGVDVSAWRDPGVATVVADDRLGVTRAAAASAQGPHDLVATLRHHGAGPWGRPGAGEAPAPVPAQPGDDGSGLTVCMHAGNRDEAGAPIPGTGITAASMVLEIPRDPDRPVRAWSCVGAPCVGVYVPHRPEAPPRGLADPGRWARHDRLRVAVESDRDALGIVRSHLDPVEASLWQAAASLEDAAPARFDRLGALADQAIEAALVSTEAELGLTGSDQPGW